MTASLRMRRAHAGGQIILDINGNGDLAPLTNDWSDLDPTAPTQLCRTCVLILPVHCFPKKTESSTGLQKWEPDCIICQYKRRQAQAMTIMWRKKADTALRSHYDRERKAGLHRCATFEEYQQETGVTVDWLADRMERAYIENDVCGHCETVGYEAHWQVICRVGEDGVPDLHDMTLDRRDRNLLLSKDNLRLMCRVGNIGRTDDPHIDAVRDRYWRRFNLVQRGAITSGAGDG